MGVPGLYSVVYVPEVWREPWRIEFVEEEVGDLAVEHACRIEMINGSPSSGKFSRVFEKTNDFRK